MALVIIELRIGRLYRVDRERKETRTGRPMNIAVLVRHKFGILLLDIPILLVTANGVLMGAYGSECIVH